MAASDSGAILVAAEAYQVADVPRAEVAFGSTAPVSAATSELRSTVNFRHGQAMPKASRRAKRQHPRARCRLAS